MNDSLRVFWGAFLLTGFSPLELDGNRCDFNCDYCYANAQKPQRTLNGTQVLNLLSELWHQEKKTGEFKRKTFAADLLRARYPVTLSNHVDFLANSNWEFMKEVMKLFNAWEIPIIMYTKWSPKEDRINQFFDLLKRPTGIYTSISSMDAAILKRHEPGAASPQQRFENIRRATELGHVCTVGINPLYEPWLGDPRPLLQACVDNGVKGVLVHELYFTQNKIKNMPQGTRKRIGEGAISDGLASRKHDADHSYRENVARIAREEFGLETWMAGQGQPSRYWDLWHDLYPVRYPMTQDFVNHCYEHMKPGDPIQFADWLNFMMPMLPAGEYRLRDHIDGNMKLAVLKGAEIPRWMEYDELLAHAWLHPEIPISPVNTACFQYAVSEFVEGNKRIDIVDENEDPVIVFSPEATLNDSIYTDNHRLQ